MTPVISYLLKMFLCSAILYGYYYAALRNNRFHQWNRYYLLLAPLLSLALPLLQLPVPQATAEAPALTAYTRQIITLREFILPAPQSGTVSYPQAAYLGYGLVVLLLLARIGYGCWKIRLLIKTGSVQHLPPYRFVESRQVQAPFSFFRYIFWSKDLNPDSRDGRQILQHELVHVKEQHSIDKLVLETACAIGWINPFFHLFRRELALVHEFIADRQAAADSVADYAQTILQASLQSRQLSFTNDFFHPPVKRRIQMLLHQKSNYTIMKRLIAFPIVAALIIFIGCQQQPQTEVGPGIIDVSPEELAKIDTKDIAHIDLVTGDDQKTTATIRTKDGKTYRAKNFTLKDQVKKDAISRNEVFTFVEEPPAFPGGEQELARYLSKNIRYPKAAQEKNISGTVFVQFVVDADGTVRDAKIVGQHKGGGLEEESLRVVESMPKWVPGRQQGHKVAVKFNLPIRYTLENKGLSLLNPFLLFKQKDIKQKDKC
ncbi:TonB family protein [Chitinophaga japonensis]|uniref:TonB family protein n=1 Tax=Chitinophaga japonensis TaxID=104662 RepID=A0A562SLA2_CHIJA|nr:TonB family protein [Chitinophaga japonensis]TWI82065.1 TonB family protein [Chitinophaga japonensis]